MQYVGIHCDGRGSATTGVGAVKKHVLILGAGFAGLELAAQLSESLQGEVRVTVARPGRLV